MTHRRRLYDLVVWETFLLALIALTVLAFSLPASPWHSPYFFDSTNMLGMSQRVIAVALMALPLTLIVIAGQIDLSVESTLAMSAIVFATKWADGLNVWIAVLAALIAGALGGLFNGLVITRVKLPSLVVTLGSYALFRGLAFLILGDHAIDLSKAPKTFLNIGQANIGSTPIPQYLLLFTLLALVIGLLLHRTSFGRYVYAIGSNEEACRYSGIRVDLIVTVLFVMSGVMAAIAGVVEAARLDSARADIGTGLLLDTVTAVVLGGVDIFGGRGTIAGPVLALILLALLRGGLGLLQVSDDVASLLVGCLLITSILLPNLLRQLQASLHRRAHSSAPASSMQ
ncbi:MAG: ABC transporter permease [Chloroflexota bacterium]